MGLDGFDVLELLFDIEMMFGIKIPNREAEVISTTGRLYAYVVEKLDEAGRLRRDDASAVSLAAKVFYHLRRELVAQLGIDRNRVRLSLRFEDLLPPEARQQAWTRLGQTLGLRLPALRRPRRLTRALWAAALLRLVAGILVLGLLCGLDGPGLLLGSAVGSVLFGWWAWRVTRPFAVHFAPDFQTIGSSVHTLVRWNYHTLIPRYRTSWSRGEVWHDLHVLLAAQLGIAADEVPIDATFRELRAA